MSQVFELAAFTVREGHEQALLDERPPMVAALSRALPGVVSSWLTQREDGSWLDVILWASREEAEDDRAHDGLAHGGSSPSRTGARSVTPSRRAR